LKGRLRGKKGWEFRAGGGKRDSYPFEGGLRKKLLLHLPTGCERRGGGAVRPDEKLRAILRPRGEIVSPGKAT